MVLKEYYLYNYFYQMICNQHYFLFLLFLYLSLLKIFLFFAIMNRTLCAGQSTVGSAFVLQQNHKHYGAHLTEDQCNTVLYMVTYLLSTVHLVVGSSVLQKVFSKRNQFRRSGPAFQVL